jgi:hypothetical protein
MTELVYLARYFHVVPPIPRLMIGSFVVLTIAGGLVTLVTAHDHGAGALPIVVLQAFSASTGFAVPARRGFYDLLLARGTTPARIAIVQWVVAVSPGLLSWAILGSIHAALDGGENPLLRSGSVVAFLMASTIPWAINVALPRFSGAIGWLLLICLASTGGVIWPDTVDEVIFPVDLVGRSLVGRPDVIVAAVLLSALSMAAALAWVRGAEIRLEAAQ